MPLSSLASVIITFYFKFTLFVAKKDNAYYKLGLSQGFCGVGKINRQQQLMRQQGKRTRLSAMPFLLINDLYQTLINLILPQKSK